MGKGKDKLRRKQRATERRVTAKAAAKASAEAAAKGVVLCPDCGTPLVDVTQVGDGTCMGVCVNEQCGQGASDAG